MGTAFHYITTGNGFHVISIVTCEMGTAYVSDIITGNEN